jgi:tyrosinase
MFGRISPQKRTLPLFFASVLLLWESSPANAQVVEVEINNTSDTNDDFVCWSPMPTRVRLADGGVANAVTLTISSMALPDGGRLVFQAGVDRPSRDTFSPTDSLDLQVSPNDGWVQFWVAGSTPSRDRDDTGIVIKNEAGDVVAGLPAMVRVRKDARRLTAGERDRFLQALRTFHDVDNGALASNYVKYAAAHLQAFNVGIHHGTAPRFWPLFLAWHRGFLLSVEQELQAIDSSVALPYWLFDQPDPGQLGNTPLLFSEDFIGTVSGGTVTPGGFRVRFSPTNPLRGWTVPGLGALVRGQDATTAALPADRLESLFEAIDFTGQLLNTDYRNINGAIEFSYHNGAHSRIAGWLGRGDSPADPLFWLLHANVDRAWAVWQARDSVRDDEGSLTAYHAQGAYPGPIAANRYRKGSYGQDIMWPWAGTDGDNGTQDPQDDWPEIAATFPVALGQSQLAPTPADMIDYLDRAGDGGALGACYDTLGFVPASQQ